MADPFELRLFFSNRLRALNPCEDNTEETVNFALKHRNLDEDFHSVILEQLNSEDNNINVRANIVYFLEDLVELARREKHFSYICMVERDFAQIIDAAIPLNELGTVNVNCVRYTLQVLHREHDVFCTEENRVAHNKAIGQNADTKTFEELLHHLEKRAAEARPDLPEPDSDEESEPDMSWIDQPQGVTLSDMEIDPVQDPPRPPDAVTTTETVPGDVVMKDLHDLPSPPGSRTPSVSSPLKTPIPPTPPSPSPSHEQPQPNGESTSAENSSSARQYSPARCSPTTESSPNKATQEEQKAQPVSPDAFTPVQKEDLNIFVPAYFELVTQRMEQDRERQRKKEDNSGFVAAASTTDEEIRQLLGKGANGYVGRLALDAGDDAGFLSRAEE